MLKEILQASYPDESWHTVAAWAGVLLRFAFHASIGDIVIHPERESRTISVGRIETDYEFGAPDLHLRKVTWLVRRIPRDQFSRGARQQASNRLAFFEVLEHADEFRGLGASESKG